MGFSPSFRPRPCCFGIKREIVTIATATKRKFSDHNTLHSSISQNGVHRQNIMFHQAPSVPTLAPPPLVRWSQILRIGQIPDLDRFGARTCGFSGLKQQNILVFEHFLHVLQGRMSIFSPAAPLQYLFLNTFCLFYKVKYQKFRLRRL